MAHVPIDWSRPGLQPGLHLLEVSKVEVKTSKNSGDPMLAVEFTVASGKAKGETLDDYFMLAGKGRYFGQQKLEALGFARGSNFDSSELIGKRAWASIVHEKSESNGKQYTNPKVNAKAQDSFAGLWPEDAPPPGAPEEGSLADAVDTTKASDESTPF